MRRQPPAASPAASAGPCLLDLPGRRGHGEQMTLQLVETGKPQQHPLLVGLDALAQDLHAKRMAERDDRLDDGAPELPDLPSEATKARSILSRSNGNLCR
jgi:hypothetical protein